MLSEKYLIAKLRDIDNLVKYHEKDNPEFVAHLIRLRESYIRELKKQNGEWEDGTDK